MNRDSKKVLIEKIRFAFSNDGVILARLGFLSYEDVIAIKKRLWINDVNFMFMKNSLAKIVVDEVGIGFLLDDFSGAIVAFYSNDLFSLMKSVNDVVNDYSDFFVLLCGKYLNQPLSLEFINNCSKFANVQSLYVQLLLTISSPMNSLIKILKKPIVDCSRCLKVSVDKQSEV